MEIPTNNELIEAVKATIKILEQTIEHNKRLILRIQGEQL